MQLPFMHPKNTLPRIRISNTDFFIDGVMREFRDVNNPHNTIPFDKLTYNKVQNGYELLFDKLTRNKYNGYMPQGGIPPMTERVLIPHLKEMDQNRAPEIDKAASLKTERHEPLKRHQPRTRKNQRM